VSGWKLRRRWTSGNSEAGPELADPGNTDEAEQCGQHAEAASAVEVNERAGVGDDKAAKFGDRHLYGDGPALIIQKHLRMDRQHG